MSDINFFESFAKLFNRIKSGRSYEPVLKVLDDGNGTQFKAKNHYFQVKVSQFFLAETRQYFKHYLPVVYVGTEYLYGGEIKVQPQIVGPAQFKEHGQEIPKGHILQNIPVTGTTLYAGGEVKITVILNRVEMKNSAEQVISILENVSQSASPLIGSLPVAPALGITRGIVEGLEVVLGLPETESLLGYQTVFTPDYDDDFRPKYIAIVDIEPSKLNAEHLWIVEDKLFFGSSLDLAEPYQSNDFVLLKIQQATSRSDTDKLSFMALWKETQKLAQRSSIEEIWREAKAHFNTLKLAIRQSNDLTNFDRKRLISAFKEEFVSLHQEAVDDADLSVEMGESMDSIEAELDRLTHDIWDELETL